MKALHDAPRLIPGISRQELVDLCYDRRWPLHWVNRADSAAMVPQTLAFCAPDEAHEIHWIDDDVVHFSYIVFAGADRERRAEELRGELQAVSDADVLAKWHTARGTRARVDAMFALGIAAPAQPDPAFQACFAEGCADEDADVRLATLTALQYRTWREFVALVAPLVEDPDPEVAGVAGRLDAYLRSVWAS